MTTAAILIGLGLAFAAFAMLGPAERSRACEHGSVGDPKCEHCPLDKDSDQPGLSKGEAPATWGAS